VTEPAEIKRHEPDAAEKQETENLLLFARAFHPGLFQGKGTMEDADRFFQLLEKDPYAVDVISMIIVLAREKSLDEPIHRRLIAFTEKHPDAPFPSTVAAEWLFARGEYEQAIPLFDQVIRSLTVPEILQKLQDASADDKGLPTKAKMCRDSLFSSLLKRECCYILLRRWDDLAKSDQFFREHPEIGQDPAVIRNRLLHLGNAMTQAEKTDGKAPLPPELHRAGASAVFRARLEPLIGPYLESLDRDLKKATKKTWALHAPVFDLFNDIGCSDKILLSLFCSIPDQPGKEQMHLLMLAGFFKSRGESGNAARAWRKMLQDPHKVPPIYYMEYLSLLEQAGHTQKAIDFYYNGTKHLPAP